MIFSRANLKVEEERRDYMLLSCVIGFAEFILRFFMRFPSLEQEEMRNTRPRGHSALWVSEAISGLLARQPSSPLFNRRQKEKSV